jgi:hypothetical protein
MKRLFFKHFYALLNHGESKHDIRQSTSACKDTTAMEATTRPIERRRRCPRCPYSARWRDNGTHLPDASGRAPCCPGDPSRGLADPPGSCSSPQASASRRSTSTAQHPVSHTTSHQSNVAYSAQCNSELWQRTASKISRKRGTWFDVVSLIASAIRSDR